MLRLAGLRLSPLARVCLGAGLAVVGYAASLTLLMLIGGGFAVAGILGSISPSERDEPVGR